MSDNYINEYKELWIKTFGDNLEFTEKYFDCFINDNSFYCLLEQNDIISVLSACQYQWMFNENLLPFAYLCGIITKEEARGKGHCYNLIKNTLNDLYQKNYFLSGLIAADRHLVNYYSKLGFHLLTDTNEEIFHRINTDNRLVDNYFLLKNADITSNQYKWFLSHRNNAVSHTKETLKLYNSDEYERFAVTYNGTVRAICVGRKSKYFIELIDFCFVNQEAKTAMLSLLCKTFKRDVKILAKQNRMLRIINAKKILSVYAGKHFDKDFEVHICDDIIPNNNITVHVHNGTVTDIANSYKIPSVSITELGKQLFASGDLFLMYEV